MFSMRNIFRTFHQIAGEPGDSVRDILNEMREFTQITADRIEQGIVPESPSDWPLLLTYPRIDPESYIPAQMSARAIVRELEDAVPELAELVEEAFKPVIESSSGFPISPDQETDPVGGLSVITMLTSYTCQIEETLPPAETIHRDLLELERLAHHTTVPLISFYAQEARSRLLKAQSESEFS